MYVEPKLGVEGLDLGPAWVAFRAVVTEMLAVADIKEEEEITSRMAGWRLAWKLGLIEYKDPPKMLAFTEASMRDIELCMLTSIPDDDSDEARYHYVAYTLGELETMALRVMEGTFKDKSAFTTEDEEKREGLPDGYYEAKSMWYFMLQRMLRHERKGSLGYPLRLPCALNKPYMWGSGDK